MNVLPMSDALLFWLIAAAMAALALAFALPGLLARRAPPARARRARSTPRSTAASSPISLASGRKDD